MYITVRIRSSDLAYLFGAMCTWTGLVVVGDDVEFATHRIDGWLGLGDRVFAIIVPWTGQHQLGYQ